MPKPSLLQRTAIATVGLALGATLVAAKPALAKSGARSGEILWSLETKG